MKTELLLALRRYLESGIGPAPRPTDAQIGLIVMFVDRRIAAPLQRGAVERKG